MSRRSLAALALAATALAALASPAAGQSERARGAWSAKELAAIESLSIERLPALPPSPGNPVADDPRAAAFGHRLFFDAALSRTGAVSCATCHRPEHGFRDPLPRGEAIGRTERRTMGLVGAAWSPWLFWDGRADSLWAQALEPLEDAREHGGTRLEHVRALGADPAHRADYEALFGKLPDLSDRARFPERAGPRGDARERAAWEAMAPADRRAVSAAFANLGRALEAWQRTLVPGPSRFDEYAAALSTGDAARAGKILEPDEVAGLGLFIDEGNCIHCHNGPLFTNHEFHNTSLFAADALPTDRGRVEGAKRVQESEFNCLGEFAAAAAGACAELDFIKDHGVELVAAFRTPTLRNVAGAGPFMHTGELATLAEVIEHYDRATPTLISDELEPLDLTDLEKRQLEAFLHALDGPLATDPALLGPPDGDGAPGRDGAALTR